MRYVIMANGKGTRWDNYRGIPKHLIPIHGETLLQRTTRLIHEIDANAVVLISSSNPKCEAEGATRHEPERGQLEIDRFCYELIDDDTCFLYGDTYYTDSSIGLIHRTQADEMQFFGNEDSIVAVKVANGKIMRDCIDRLLALIKSGVISDAKGWHLYHLFKDMPLEGKEIGDSYILLKDNTTDFNWPSDYDAFISENKE